MKTIETNIDEYNCSHNNNKKYNRINNNKRIATTIITTMITIMIGTVTVVADGFSSLSDAKGSIIIIV